MPHNPRMTVFRGHPPTRTTELSELQAQAIAELFRSGGTNKEIAAALDTTEEKIRGYFREAYRKMGVTTRAELILKMVKSGMVDFDG